MRYNIYSFIKCRYPLVNKKKNILNNKTCYDILDNFHLNTSQCT